MTAWKLAAQQHGIVTRAQLHELGVSRRGIEHRLRKGRLHRLPGRARPWRGIYLVGRPELTQQGRLMAAALFAGPDAVLSHTTAAIVWGIRRAVPAVPDPGRDGGIEPSEIEITVPPCGRRPVGLRVHRRAPLPPEDRAIRDGIPVTHRSGR